MGSVKVIENESHFQSELQNAGIKLVVVDFSASWCPPCERIAPKFAEMSRKYPKAVFLKVDVDQCPETAAAHAITAMPTFILFRNKAKVDRVQGADEVALDAKIQHHYGTGEEAEDDAGVQGHMDLTTFIVKQQCECLNESDEHPFVHCLSSGGGYLESDVDEQLIISISFTQSVKVHSLKIKAPQDKGPKTIKIFINQPRTLDFDMADSFKPVQEIELTPEDLDGTPVNLRYVKFQNVQNIQLFIRDNQAGGEVTAIDHLVIVGSPISTTNMSEFKRVSGRKGESH
ncbi:thioredoxin-like protein 1 [Hetaerina americana]|uniref:thioredoxin-like protein 1 n=1 Tax=Hetaerina americana TaxID=62018 RepID=UPI003A7F546E